MKNKILSMVICLGLMIGITPVVQADATNDYKTIYLDYAKDADTNYDNKLNDGASGMILLDLNKDEVPELLAYSRSVTYYDAEGNQISPFAEESKNPAYTEYDYDVRFAFSIIDGNVVEDSPWRGEFNSTTIKFPFLPDEIAMIETEEFCTTARYDRGPEDYLVMYDVSESGSSFTTLWYDEEGFGFSCDRFDASFYDSYHVVDLPTASIHFYDDEAQQKRTRSEAMAILLDKYENAVNASNNDMQNKVSDWAAAEVAEAKDLNLIPPEMLNDDFTEDITRAEFAAIAVQLNHANQKGVEFDWDIGHIVDIAGNPYKEYVYEAYHYGIVYGTGVDAEGNCIFEPNMYITREQMATMLCRLMVLQPISSVYVDYFRDPMETLDISGVPKYADDADISEYAINPVYYMTKQNIIKGVDSTHFAPLDTATKEQAILLALRIHNAFNELPVEQGEDPSWIKIY